MRLPLESWTLHMEHLPQRLQCAADEGIFSLPGADALGEFAELIGNIEEESPAGQAEGVPYTLSGLFEDDLSGELTLSKEIDFGALSGDRAVLTFEHIAGRGDVLLGGRQIARFGDETADALLNAFDSVGMPCRLCVDVTDALLLGASERLELRFDDARPAGVLGAAFLSTSQRAYLSRVSVQGDARRSTMTIRARTSAMQDGEYVLRVQLLPGKAGAQLPPARETAFTLAKGEEKGVVLSMEASAGRLIPGKAYDAPAVRIQLFCRIKEARELLCDDALLMCGYGADAPKAFVPLDDRACMGDADALCERLKQLHVPAVYLGVPAPDGLYRALSRAGIAAVQHVSEALRPAFTRYPCLTLADEPALTDAPVLEAAAWQLSGSTAFPRVIDDSLSPDELLFEASGRRLDPADDSVRASLAWLRVVQIRLRAEAARQGRYQGALCSAQEAESAEIQEAIQTAFAPVHLSALPLSGAWWTGTRFSASLEAFIPNEGGEEIHAQAVLEDEDGNILASLDAYCKRSGYAGVIEAQLPDKPCVLMLGCRLTQEDRLLEGSSLPVYVGDLGPLEAAFS